VRESYANPAETFEVNVMGTISVLDALRGGCHPCSVVIVSTDKCYENREWEYGYREVDRLGGHDPYSASKAAMEVALASYRLSFFPPERVDEHGVRLASARAGNVIGGGDWSKDRIVPDAIRALSAGEPLKVRKPDSVRPWQHVLEPLSGYLWLAVRMSAEGGKRYATSWNFGPLPGDAHTVGKLADSIVETWGTGSWYADDEAGSPHEASLLMLSIDRARVQLGWEPVWDFDTAVGRTVAWYKSFYTNQSSQKQVYGACLDDIEAYERAAKEKNLAWTS
jgi:CDP-glucose 4,6-dehydratase